MVCSLGGSADGRCVSFRRTHSDQRDRLRAVFWFAACRELTGLRMHDDHASDRCAFSASSGLSFGSSIPFMKTRIRSAETKYFAIFLPFTVNFRLITTKRHFFVASKTPDPELPVVATSLNQRREAALIAGGQHAGGSDGRSRRLPRVDDDDGIARPGRIGAQLHGRKVGW